MQMRTFAAAIQRNEDLFIAECSEEGQLIEKRAGLANVAAEKFAKCLDSMDEIL
jgi:hypothetical protein